MFLELEVKKRVNILINSFSFKIRFRSTDDFSHIENIATQYLTTYTSSYDHRTKRFYKEKDKDYFIIDRIRLEFRFPIGLISPIMKELGNRGITKEDIFILRERGVREEYIQPLDLEDISGMELRDYQKEYVDILTDETKPNMLLVDMATGGGKGFCLAQSMLKWNMRTAILLIPAYIEKWILEFQKYFSIQQEEILVIQGGDSIRQIFSTPSEELKYKIVIISLRTLMNFIQEYQEGDNSYGGTPDELLTHLGVGLLATDETHQHYYSVYMALLYLNTKRLIAMSATLETNKKDIQRLYDIVFPTTKKLSGIYDPGKHVTVVAIDHNYQSIRHLKFKRTMGYDHKFLEQNILKRTILLRSYTEMVAYYIDKRDPKSDLRDKAMIFFATVDMCTYMTAQLRDMYPDLDIRRYVGEDPYENVIEPDIVIGTPGGMSTGIDIPGLITVINTVAMISSQQNIQTLGRLRKRPNRELYFCYFYTTQLRSHKERRNLYYSRAKHMAIESYPKMLRMM